MVNQEHALKIWPEFFADVVSGAKRYEIRFNDRGYEQGDVLLLREWDANTRNFTGKSCKARVMYITRSGDLGPLDRLLGFQVCVMGIEVFE